MADLEKTVAVIFKGDDQISSTLKAISKNFSGFSDIAQDVAEPLANIADGVLKADAALAAMAVGGMALAIREAGNFGDSFNEISTLIDAPRENLDQFRRDIIEYAKDSTASFEDIAAATYTAISAGINYADSLAFLSAAEKLNIAGRGDLESTTRLLASTLNAYGESVDKATYYSDIFFTVVRDGQTTLSEQADGLSKVTAAAATAGIPIGVLGAALAALTANGDPTSQALTKIQAILTAITKPSKEASEAAAALNIEFSAAALKSEGFAGFLKKVYDAADGNSAILTKLFGSVEAYNGAAILGADRSGTFAKALADMEKAAGATQKAFEKMVENFGLVNQQMANNVRAVLISVGEDLLAGYLNIAKGVIDVLKSISGSIDAGVFDELFAAFDGFAAELTVFLKEVAAAMPEALAQLDFSGFLNALRGLGDAIGGLFGDVDLSTPDDLADVMQEIIDTGEALIRVTTGMALAFEPYFTALRRSVQEVNTWDAETQESFGKVLLAAKAVVEAGVLIAGAMAAIEQSGSDITNVFNVVVGSVKAAWNLLQVAFDTVASMVVNSVIDILDAIIPLTRLPGLEEFNRSILDIRQSLGYMSEAIRIDSANQMQEALDDMAQAADGFAGRAHDAGDAAKNLNDEINKTPAGKDVDISIWVNNQVAQAGINEVKDHLEDLQKMDPDLAIQLNPRIKADADLLDELFAIVDSAQDKVEGKPEVKPKVNTDEAKIELERFKAQLDVLETAIEWEAKLEITQAQEATKRLEAAFASVNVGIQSTGETLVGLFNSLGNVEGFTQRWLAEDAIRQEIDLRKQAFDSQQGLIQSTKELNRAKAERLRSGDALITISGEGLSPALEMVLWNIVELVQMRVIETGSDALIDLGSFGGI